MWQKIDDISSLCERKNEFIAVFLLDQQWTQCQYKYFHSVLNPLYKRKMNESILQYCFRFLDHRDIYYTAFQF